MNLIDNLISKLAPHECTGCGQEGSLLCRYCGDILYDPVLRDAKGSLGSVWAVTSYQEFAKDLVWQLKFQGARAAADIMADLMSGLGTAGSETLVVPVPTASKRARQRGYDQAKLLARGIASRKRLLYADCLRRAGQSHQVGASREQRLRQLGRAFRLKDDYLVRGRHVILVDDVMTTGATLEAAAAVLNKAGAGRVEAVVFALA